MKTSYEFPLLVALSSFRRYSGVVRHCCFFILQWTELVQPLTDLLRNFDDGLWEISEAPTAVNVPEVPLSTLRR